MKVLPFKIPKPTNAAILFQVDEGVLYNSLHNHEEVQISFIKEGSGTLFAGDAIHSFVKGDIIVLGSHQPHVFNSDGKQALMHTVFFSLASFGDTFLALDEGKGIVDFYAFAKAGFKTSITPDIAALFNYIATAKGIYKLGYFINIITALKVAKHSPLSEFIYERHISEKDGKRMSAIFDYTLSNYHQDITLAQLAALTALTPHGFCKYFKQRTNKTYFTFLTEVRISKACTYLATDSDLTIGTIADLCGYKTLSHFNKSFKSIKGITPTVFRKGK